MLSFLIYEGKVAIALAVFSLFYRLLLKKESFHRMNRMVLVGALLVSFLLPMCVITIHKPMEMAPLVVIDEVPSMTGVAGTVSGPWWPMALTVLFFAGVAFVLTRELVSILSVLRIIRQGEQVREEDGCKIIITNRDVGPFSWMRYIVLSRQDWACPHESILTHEKAHIHYHHSVELLLVDILTAFQWFNPAIWVLRMDLQELHEYEADEAVLRSGANLKDYQYLLVKKAVSKSGYSVANSFNHSILKNRITMMSKSKSPLLRGLRVLWLLPLVCLGLTLQAQTVYVQSDKDSNKNGKRDVSLPKLESPTMVLTITADGKVKGIAGTKDLDGFGTYLRGRMGNIVLPTLTVQIKMEPGTPASYVDKLKDELRKVGILKLNRHE